MGIKTKEPWQTTEHASGNRQESEDSIFWLQPGFRTLFHYIWDCSAGKPLRSTGYNPWLRGQPDNAGGKENCGSLHRKGGMNDISCPLKLAFFCELEVWRHLILLENTRAEFLICWIKALIFFAIIFSTPFINKWCPTETNISCIHVKFVMVKKLLII